MRNQIINLVLTGALLTTSSLCAMEVPQDEDSKASIKLHTCQVCAKDKTGFFELTEGEAVDNKGYMHSFPDEILKEIICESENGAYLLVSKHMYNLCQDSLFWEGFARNEKFLKFDPTLCPKYQVSNFYTLFRDITQTYTTTVLQLLLFKDKELCKFEDAYKLRKSYQDIAGCIEIGKRKFQIITTRASESLNSDPLNLLEGNTSLTFEWMNNKLYYPLPCFKLSTKHSWIITNKTNLTFGTQEYVELATDANHAANAVYNEIYIRELPKEEQK